RKVTDLNCDCGRIHNLFIKNDHLHAASDKGVKIFSLADRLQPQEIITIADTYEVYDGYGLRNRIGVVTGESGKFILFDVKDDAISDTTAPETVTRLTALGQGFASIKLSWQAATDNAGGSGVAGYRIFRDDYSADFPYASVNAPKTWFVDPACEPGTAYSYSIKTFDRSDNTSPASSKMTVLTKALNSDDKAPTAPVGLDYAATREKVELNWRLSFDGDSGVEFYELYKTRISDNNPGGNLLPQKLTSLFTSYTDTKIIAGAEYEYQIRAIDYAGNPSPLTSITVKIPKNSVNPQYSYFFPHFCLDDDWDTIFSFTNLSAKNAEADLQLFAADGEKLLEQKLYKFRPEDGFSPETQIASHDHIFRHKIPQETAWMRVNSNSKLSLLTILESTSYLDAQKGVANGSGSLIFPVVERGENCWTGLALANPTASPAQILLLAYDQAGELQAFSDPFFLPANGQVAALADDFFSAASLPEETVTIRAESTAKIVGLEFFSLPDTDMASLSAIPFSNIDACATSSYLYTILNNPDGGDNEISVSLVNLTPKPAAITLFWQDCTDVTKQSESLIIPGLGKHSFSRPGSTPQSYDLGALKIISDQPAAIFQTLNPTSQAKTYASAYAFSSGLDEINFTHLRVDYHDKAENNIFTITNLSRIKQNHLTLELFQGDGELLMTFEKTIPAGSTCTLKLRDLAGFDYRNLSHRDSWMRIRADLPINGFYTYESADREKLIVISAE
ncbi:MAG: fibronectin type III domain-containing protein, partial [Pseudomonadota bacterium]|nr:fibronectin type III domain-containing protein [Pseudomonadota bacterium]